MVKFGIRNFIVVGVMAMLFFVVAKVIAARYPVKGIADVVQAA